jgi:hypothetical protein
MHRGACAAAGCASYRLVSALSSTPQLPLQACGLPAKSLLGPHVALKGVPLGLALVIACSRARKGAVVCMRKGLGCCEAQQPGAGRRAQQPA